MTLNKPVADRFDPPAQLNIPILFIVFNRPESTAEVFEAIRKAKPPRLYVAADGPRANNNEMEKIFRARKLATAVDWPCEVHELFRDENLGCGPAVKTAIDWFFEHELAGIILEDDTVPVRSFFWFCEELLMKYQNDTRIGMVAGTNHIGYQSGEFSYLFSKNKACWGWATWRRAWVNMDFEMEWRKTESVKDVMMNMGVTKWSRPKWLKALEAIDNGLVNAWDWQWYFSLSTQNQLCIFPNRNLVANVGFGKDATHTRGIVSQSYVLKNDIQFPLIHPEKVCPDYGYDYLFEKTKMKSSWIIKKGLIRLAKILMRKF
jgi:hypothetical protein